MFGNKRTAETQAVVVNCKMGGLQNSKNEYRCKLDLRVQFDDGTTEDVTVHAFTVGAMNTWLPGNIVPVLYNPGKRTDVEVNRDKIRAEKTAGRAEAQAALVAMAEKQLKDQAGKSA